MAAPVFAQWYSYSFRDAKGNVSRTRVLVGAASSTAAETYSVTLKGLIQAVSNATVWNPNQDGPNHTLGTAATYLDVEDKAVLVFHDPSGYRHTFQIAAPKSAGFLADQETVKAAETNMAALLASMQANIYGRATDTSALIYDGGFRLRRKMHRKINIYTLSANLDEANP